MTIKLVLRKRLVTLIAALWTFTGGQQSLAAAPADLPPATSCSQFMAPKKNVGGKPVGQEDCQMQDAGIVDQARKLRRIEMGVSGTLSGWIVRDGPRSNHFTSAPDFLFTQYGNIRPRAHGILRYEAAKGTSLTVIYPETGWNGKLFVLVHGASGAFRKGNMKPWDQVFNPASPLGDVTKYEQSMLARGFAIARSRRNADRDAPGDYAAVLDDGQVWPDQNIDIVPELILDQAKLVRNFLKDRLGSDAKRIYWYGHSGGAHMGLLVNYLTSLDAEFNRDADGTTIIDGFLDDDPGGGMFMPILTKNGQDIMYRTPADKAKFIKTIVVAHQLYPAFYSKDTPWLMDPDNVPKFVATSYLQNKRTTARVFREKGLYGVYRMYEVRGISHNGGENLPNGKDDDIEMLDLSRLIDGMIDVLDNWVEKGTEPPATKSDEPGLSPNKNAIDLPETACPLGVYYAYPPNRGVAGVGYTGFAAYDGDSMEPLDGRSQFVDMNGNGRRDQRESVTEAWRRLRLLKPAETVNGAVYASCVRNTVEKLRKEGLITEVVGNQYVAQAAKAELP